MNTRPGGGAAASRRLAASPHQAAPTPRGAAAMMAVALLSICHLCGASRGDDGPAFAEFARTRAAAGGIPRHKQPLLQYVRTIAYDPKANVRDPSPVIQDPATGRWHFWVDWMPPGPVGTAGWRGDGWHASLRHYSAPEIEGPWVASHGFALNHSTDPSAWDYSGQFSSSAIYDAADKTWWLYYSASGANQTKFLTNAQMVCSSPSPEGPWTRRGLSAWPTGSPASNWSQSTHATPNCKVGQEKCWNSRFVDSGRALIVGGRRGFWTKGVEGGVEGEALVASEGLYLPSTPSSFAPPYREALGNPVYPPFGKSGEEAGYENCEFFMGREDGLLHILCTWDGGTLGPPGLPRGVHPHFVVDLKTDPLAEHWIYVGAISVYNSSSPGIGKTVPMAGEPTPVYEHGAPGDNATVRFFIAREDYNPQNTHGGPGSLRIGLFSLTWIDPLPPAPPAPPQPPAPPPPGPPGPVPACPVGWATHAPGFWSNHEDYNRQNSTVALCEKQCLSTPGCMAFDVCAAPTPACDCYIFKGLVEPFTPNPGDLTCVREEVSWAYKHL